MVEAIQLAIRALSTSPKVYPSELEYKLEHPHHIICFEFDKGLEGKRIFIIYRKNYFSYSNLPHLGATLSIWHRVLMCCCWYATLVSVPSIRIFGHMSVGHRDAHHVNSTSWTLFSFYWLFGWTLQWVPRVSIFWKSKYSIVNC